MPVAECPRLNDGEIGEIQVLAAWGSELVSHASRNEGSSVEA